MSWILATTTAKVGFDCRIFYRDLMSSKLLDKLVFRISDAELERRWALARKEMEKHNIDVLVMQGSNEFKGGYIRWFTDVPAKFDGPTAVIFPRHGKMTVVTNGPRNGRQTPPDDNSGLYRGVAQVLTAPYSQADCTSDYADGALAVSVLKELAPAKVGWLGMGSMRFSFGHYLVDNLTGVEFVNMSNEIDRLKAVKSPEEMRWIEQCAHLQDEVWKEVLEFVRPGLREYEVSTFAYYQSQLRGSTEGLILTGSAPMGTASVKGHRLFQNRVLQKGDQFTMLIEVNGPGGFYTELGRTCVLGSASSDLLDEFAVAREAQDNTARILKPGITPTEVWESHNAFMRQHGRPEEQRLFCHGQGYDLVERPSLRDDDTMVVETDMNLVIHPTYVTPSVYSWICDNYAVEEAGVRRLHKTERKIFELN